MRTKNEMDAARAALADNRTPAQVALDGAAEKLGAALGNAGKYTPGPWRVFGNVVRAVESVDGEEVRGSVVAMPMCAGSVERRHFGEFDANARLIAAAPDMLAALIECRRMILAGTAHPDEYVSVIDAAIARAEGGGK